MTEASAKLTLTADGSYGRSKSPGSSSQSEHPGLIACAVSGQCTRASKYGPTLSRSTKYCTSGVAITGAPYNSGLVSW